MIFSSPIFLFVFLPSVFLLYRVSRNITYRNILLAVSSIVFYAFGQLNYVPLFLGSVLLNYFAGFALKRVKIGRKAILAFAVAANLGILAVFKYTDFVIGNINALTGSALAPTGILLPIGISFFTFQGLSYTIDVYREPDSGTVSFLDLLLLSVFSMSRGGFNPFIYFQF